MPEHRHRFASANGTAWQAAIISHGRTSGYLNPKVHRPIVEFRCLDRQTAPRYTPLPQGIESLGSLGDDALRDLLADAKAH